MQPILIADDSETDVQDAICLLHRTRILNPVHTVSSGEETIAYLSGKGIYADRTRYPYPLLLLLDLKMRGVSGWDVLRWIKETKQRTKVVVLTGMEIQHIKDSYSMGAQSFLYKPVKDEDFANLLNHLSGITVRTGEDGLYLRAH